MLFWQSMKKKWHMEKTNLWAIISLFFSLLSLLNQLFKVWIPKLSASLEPIKIFVSLVGHIVHNEGFHLSTFLLINYPIFEPNLPHSITQNVDFKTASLLGSVPGLFIEKTGWTQRKSHTWGSNLSREKHSLIWVY